MSEEQYEEDELVVDDHFEESEGEVADIETEVEVDPMGNMVDAVIAGDFSSATVGFHDELNSRIRDAIDAKSIEVGSRIGVENEYTDDSNEDGAVENTDDTE